jgi:DNA-binding transcriptional regulator YhcF (GntR family)
MILRVRTDSPVPPYEQLRAQIATMVASGVLAPGARLPTIRQLASDLGLAGGTVTRAYRELERDGVITGRGRHGAYVRERPADGGRARAAGLGRRRIRCSVVASTRSRL